MMLMQMCRCLNTYAQNYETVRQLLVDSRELSRSFGSSVELRELTGTFIQRAGLHLEILTTKSYEYKSFVICLYYRLLPSKLILTYKLQFRPRFQLLE